MRWIVKTSRDGTLYDDVFCDGTPLIPDNRSSFLIPVDGSFVAGVVSETSVEKNQDPAVLRITCLNPDAYSKS